VPDARRSRRIGTALTLLAAWGCGREQAAPARPPNLVLVTVDTLRADHTQLLGYPRATTPELVRMAAEGVLFTNAIAQASWTLPSIASVHTALYPSQHGAVGGELALPEAAETLAERLHARGYHTVAVVSHSFVGREHGFAQGFDVFDDSQSAGHDAVTSAELTRVALERVAGADEPFFLWVHYFDPHFSYVAHPEYGFGAGYRGRLPPKVSAQRLKDVRELSSADLDYLQALYDEEIAFTDEWIGRLWSGIRERSGAERTVLAVSADHGEYFQERGRFFHGKDVYQALVHVPLLITGALEPGLRGAVVAAPVETRDLARTLFTLAGGDPAAFGGADLLELARGAPAPAVFSEGSHAFGEDERKVAVVLDGWKLIHDLDRDGYELYSLRADPDERDDLWSSVPEGAPLAELQRALAEFARLPRLESRRIELDAGTRKDLEALGYAR